MYDLRPDSDETLRLLTQVDGGERDAIERLLARYRPWMRWLVQLRLDTQLQPRLDASDVVQDAQLESYRRLPDYLQRRPMPFRLWLRKLVGERLRMAERQHLEADRRAVGREAAVVREASGKPLSLPGTDPTPSQQFVRQELAGQVRQALGRLPEADCEVILMRTYEDLAYAEIAYLLGIEEAAARKRFGRALVRLHAALRAEGMHEGDS